MKAKKRYSNMTPAYIYSIGTAVPSNKISLDQAYRFMKNSMELNHKEAIMLRQIHSFSGIDYRYTVIDDFLKDKGEFSFFSNNLITEPEPPVSKRMELFEKYSEEMCSYAIADCLSFVPHFDKKNITHVITFSCTGMSAPGLDIKMVKKFGLDPGVERLCINFMGCYAGINAIKTAYHTIRSQPASKVLLIGVELCTLHYRVSKDAEQMVANAIFGDGASAILISAADNLLEGASKLKLKTFYSEFAYEGCKDMIWSIAEHGFNLKLSDTVPKMIKQEISTLVAKLFDRASLKKEDISYYAIHPGGVKILEACEEALSISKEQNNFSYEILRNYGNMSSVTVLFVLQQYLKKFTENDKEKNLLSCAFGPGLTMESMILQVA